MECAPVLFTVFGKAQNLGLISDSVAGVLQLIDFRNWPKAIIDVLGNV